MTDLLKKDWVSQITVGYFVILSLWWLFLQTKGVDQTGIQFDLFTVIYGFMAVWGGYWGIITAKDWGLFKSTMGKAITMFSFGLLAQEFGQLGYTYYIYLLKIDLPYPSWGDLGFFGSIPFYIAGIFYLAQVTGVKVSIKSYLSKIQSILIPIIGLAFSYYFFLLDYPISWDDPLKVFLDFGYPLGQATYVSLAFVTYFLSRGVLGGIMKNKILFILFALLVQYIADYMFLYQASRQTWTVSGFNDYIYFVAYFVMTMALLKLKSSIAKLRS